MSEEINTEIERTLAVLKVGGTILYPTDTIWGIGCDALNAKAIDKVYKIKNRNESKSLIILVNDYTMLNHYVGHVPEIASDLIERIDNPVTVIYDNSRNLPKNLGASDGTIGIRIVRDAFCQQLISAFGKPIVSTSANISGEESPMVYSKISDEVKKKVDYTVSLNHNQINQTKASTIIRLFENGDYKIIRE